MWTTILLAVISSTAALAGVALGAFVEPIKQRAAQRARVQQERFERCAELVEAAYQARGLVVAVNRAYRGERPAFGAVGEPDWSALDERYHTARAKVRTLVGVLRIYGPDELAEKAEAIKVAESALAHVRFSAVAEVRDGRPVSIPVEMGRAGAALDRAIIAFTDAARIESLKSPRRRLLRREK